jgi:bifunctional UDP-N-acetylglucosamine pyrophosphorylase/glucosamine-1-phosphate N-acetyltransferase
MDNFQSIILAAGKGTRLESDKAKVLHEVLGRPMISWAVQAALEAGAERAVVVTGYQRERVEGWLVDHEDAERIEFTVQDEQLGTGHAVWMAEEYLREGPKYTLIQYGDVPLMDANTLGAFVQDTADSRRPVGLMTALLDDPAQYGRIVRDGDGDIVDIVEYADASPDQRAIDEINAGFYTAATDFLVDHLPEIVAGDPDNAQQEYYLTDLIERAVDSHGVFGFECPDPHRIQGVNTRDDLAGVTEFARNQINREWMEAGVTMLDPSSTYVEPTIELARDVVLHPGVELRGETAIGSGTVVENGAVIRDSEIAGDVHVKPNCDLNKASVDSGTSLGPFAHLRPGADIGKNCKVGNYVEVKKSRLEDGVQAGHHTYLGDAHVGEGTNVGAGTITCNYDGEEKHRTSIGEEAFIGSNTSLVAPVEIGDGAYIGAGSTITEDVPADALGVARGRQNNIEGWARDED